MSWKLLNVLNVGAIIHAISAISLKCGDVGFAILIYLKIVQSDLL